MYPDPMPSGVGGAPPRSRAGLLLAIALLLFVGALFAARPSADPDLPWHLRTGQLALERHSTLPVDPFSYSFEGAPWRYKDLLADVLLYLGSATLGRFSIPLLRVLVTLAYPLVLALALDRRDRRPLALAVLIALSLCGFGLSERPQLFGHLLFLALLASLDRAHRLLADADAPADDARALARALGPVLATQWLWVCLHRSGLIGLALGLAFPLRLALAHRFRWAALGPYVSRRAVVASALAGVAAVALACVNPSGLAFFTSSFAVERSAMMRQYVTDFRPIGLLGYYRAFPVGAALVVVALIAGWARVALTLRPGVRAGAGQPGDGAPPRPSLLLWHVALLSVSTALLWSAARWLQFAALCACLVLTHVVGELTQLVEARGRTVRGLGALAAVVAAAVVTAVAGPGVDLASAEDPRLYPIGAVAFAKEHGLSGKVATPLYYGGYVLQKLWPGTRVLVDGRNDTVYPPDFVVRTIFEGEDPAVFADARRGDGASWVIASNAPGRVTHRFLAADPAWMLVYWSDFAVVYASRAAHPELASLQLDALRDPDAVLPEIARALDAKVDPRRIHEQLQRMVAASPTSVRAGGALCLYYQRMGPTWWSRRDAALRALKAIAPEHPIVQALEREIAATGR